MELPKFTYFPDPIKVGSIEASEKNNGHQLRLLINTVATRRSSLQCLQTCIKIEPRIVSSYESH